MVVSLGQSVFVNNFVSLGQSVSVDNSYEIAPTTQATHYNPQGFLTFMLKIFIILEELLQRPKVTIIIREDF